MGNKAGDFVAGIFLILVGMLSLLSSLALLGSANNELAITVSSTVGFAFLIAGLVVAARSNIGRA